MTTADALLAAVIASPDDDLPRLVYADWLDEQGEPDRAEFIRVQCALARGEAAEELLIREKVLQQLHAERWLAPLRRRGEPLFTRRSHAEFRRGFVQVVWLPTTEFVKHAGRLFAVAPVRELRATFDHGHDVTELMRCEHLARLRVLDVCDNRFGPAVAFQLAYSGGRYRTLKVLRMRACNLSDEYVSLLCGSRLTLDELDLRHNPLSPAACAELRQRFGDAVRVG